jgi:hypothetical protein
VVAYIHDSEGLLREAPIAPGAVGLADDDPEVRCVIGASG